MNGWICNKCGSDDKSVSNFYHIRGKKFDMENPEKLCWDCKYPILHERIHGKKESEMYFGNTNTSEESQDGDFTPTLLDW